MSDVSLQRQADQLAARMRDAGMSRVHRKLSMDVAAVGIRGSAAALERFMTRRSTMTRDEVVDLLHTVAGGLERIGNA